MVPTFLHRQIRRVKPRAALLHRIGIRQQWPLEQASTLDIATKAACRVVAADCDGLMHVSQLDSELYSFHESFFDGATLIVGSWSFADFHVGLFDSFAILGEACLTFVHRE